MGRRRDASRTHRRGKSPRRRWVSGEKDDRAGPVSWEDLDHDLSRIAFQETPRRSPTRTSGSALAFLPFPPRAMVSLRRHVGTRSVGHGLSKRR